MRQVLPMFRPSGESHRAKVLCCGIEVDHRLQVLGQQGAAELIAVSHPTELARCAAEGDWGCVVAGDGAADSHALESVARFTKERPGLGWIVWSSKLEWPVAVGAMQLGAMHVLRCPQDDEALPGSLASAIRLGQERLLAWRQESDVRRRFDELSESERQVLEMVMKGRTNKEVALQLDFSLRTVESRRQRILRIMQTENVVTLAGLLARHGMLDQIATTSPAVKPQSASA